jgi:hypothetical protein
MVPDVDSVPTEVNVIGPCSMQIGWSDAFALLVELLARIQVP